MPVFVGLVVAPVIVGFGVVVPVSIGLFVAAPVSIGLCCGPVLLVHGFCG